MSDFAKDFYTIEEAAELLKVHVNTLYNMTRKGRIAYYKIGKQKRIPTSELEKLKIERTQ